MTAEKLATVKVFRFDPAIDKKPRYETYNVPYEQSSVQQVLIHIFEDIDPTLAFRTGCRRAWCMGCPVLVNGMPALSCTTLAEANMTVEPHPKFEVKKDLITDLDKVKKDYKPSDKPSTVKIVVDKEKCIGCGDCVKSCPVGVYEIKGGKAYPIDNVSCCGWLCRNCVNCLTGAISFTQI